MILLQFLPQLLTCFIFSANLLLGAEPLLVRSKASGEWSNPKTWEKEQVPLRGQRVLIRTGHEVVYDMNSKAVLHAVHISGTLRFNPSINTRLEAGLITVQAGEVATDDGFDCSAHVGKPDPHQNRSQLLVGTQDAPIQANCTAMIRLHHIQGMNPETCPAIICCGGKMDFHGQPLSHSWTKLAKTVTTGDTELILKDKITGWNPGDRVIVTATQRYYDKDDQFTEERFVESISNTDPPVLKLTKPLEHEHLGDGLYSGEVANLSRNVIVESANPDGVRGHTMYHRHSAGSISYAEFRHLGKMNILGKYAIHYHLCKDTMRGSSIVGASIWDSDNRWVTIHGTEYLVVRDCVGWKSIGHGFFLEDGTEVYNILDRNLAVGARAGKRLPKQALPFDANDGAGFWWASSLNTFTNNVASDNDRYGFRYEATPTSALKLDFAIRQPDGSREIVDIRRLPFIRFSDNEVHSNVGLYGVNLGEGVRRVGPDSQHPFVVRNLNIWNVHYGFRPQVPSLMVENLNLHRIVYGVYHPDYDKHFYKNVTISEATAEPFNRGHDDESIQHGILTVDGLNFINCKSGGMPLIQISDHNPTGNAVSHFRNVKITDWKDGSRAKSLVNLGGGPRPEPKTEKGVPIYLHDWFGKGKHAMVVSTRSPEYKADPMRFRTEPTITGNESKLTDVNKIEFPKVLEPTDDLPPITIITRVQKTNGGVLVTGSSSDNHKVAKVIVNGVEATSTNGDYSEWKVVLKAGNSDEITAIAIDSTGLKELTPHRVIMAN
ncbi:MAG: G8 domain-containing protein [Zavarzinella sp.]